MLNKSLSFNLLLFLTKMYLCASVSSNTVYFAADLFFCYMFKLNYVTLIFSSSNEFDLRLQLLS